MCSEFVVYRAERNKLSNAFNETTWAPLKSTLFAQNMYVEGSHFPLPLTVSRFIAGIEVFQPPVPPGRRYSYSCHCYVVSALTKDCCHYTQFSCFLKGDDRYTRIFPFAPVLWFEAFIGCMFLQFMF